MSLTADDIKTVVAMTKHPGYAIMKKAIEDKCDALKRNSEWQLGNIHVTAEASRMVQLRNHGEIKGLMIFVNEPKKMMTLITEPLPTEGVMEGAKERATKRAKKK